MSSAILGTSTALRTRQSQVQEIVSSEGWSGLLVLDLVDIAWLTGLESTNAAAIVTPDSVHVATDFRYSEQASKISGITVHQLDQGLFQSLGKNLKTWAGAGTVGYSPSSLTHSAFLQLTKEIESGVTLRASTGTVGKLRQVKDSAEIAAIRRASDILETVYHGVVERGLIGRTEGEVSWSMERHMRDLGASGTSFDPIVASGFNGAYPHHHPANDVIGPDTLVTIDIGAIVDGYCSDCTRAFATGQLSDTLRTIYNVTLEAQGAALASIKPGIRGSDVDAVARGIIERAGYGERFGHGLGHGVGMEVHEGPRLSKISEDVLTAGMVVTVEPGIYVPDHGGVRIEDLVVVTTDGYECLTGFSKELITIEERG